MASTYLTKTFGSAGNQKTWTHSVWLKRSKLSTFQAYFSNYTDGPNRGYFAFYDDNIYFYNQVGGSDVCEARSSSVYRDTSAWYHIVVKCDTTQATSSDRFKVYINGVEISLTFTTTPLQNADLPINDNGAHYISSEDGSSSMFDGVMAHVHFIDGTAYDASTFGQTDATTGIWKPKTAPSVTYGTNGFFLKFASAGSLGTDSSGNGNNFTLSGSGTQTQDTPSNVFATLNSVYKANSQPTFSVGNLRQAPNTTTYQNAFSTIGVTSGKWYVEMKVNGTANSANYYGVVAETEVDYLQTAGNVVGTTDKAFAIAMASGDKRSNGSNSSYGSAIANTDIFMIALDLDNAKVWFGKNGTWFASGDPASGSNPAFSGINTDYPYFFGGTAYQNGYTSVDYNFGNGYFGTTAVSSAQSPSDGIGIFEYAVPSGYKALCTKSINAQEYS